MEGTRIVRNHLGYVNTRAIGQSDTEYENCDSEGSIPDQLYNYSDIDIGMSSDSAELEASASSKLTRHVLYVNEMEREAYMNKQDNSGNQVQRTDSAIYRGVADGKDSEYYYTEGHAKTTFMEELNIQRAFMDTTELLANPKSAKQDKTATKPKVSLWKTKVMPLILRSRQERDSAVTKAWQNAMMTQRVLNFLKANDDTSSVADDGEAWSVPVNYDNNNYQEPITDSNGDEIYI